MTISIKGYLTWLANAIPIVYLYQDTGADVNLWLLHATMQSLPITTNVVSSNPAHGEAYSIQN